MGLLKFRIPSPLAEPRLADLRKSYVTGLDRTPSRLSVEIRKDLLICQRGTTESGRLFAPWPVEGFGTPFIGTATLGERPEPYPLAVELARGKLNDVRNQLADWKQMGLRVPAELDRVLRRGPPGASVKASHRPRRPGRLARLGPEEPEPRLGGEPVAGRGLRRPGPPESARRPASCPPSSPSGWRATPRPLPWAAKIVAVVQRRPAPLHVEVAGADRREAPLGRPRRPARLGDPQEARGPGRPADRPPARRPARLDLALVGRLRRDPRHGRRHRPPGRRPVPGQDPALAPDQPAGLDRHPGDVRGRPDPPDRPAAPGRPPGRPRGAVPGRARPPLGRVDGLEHLPARPAPPGRLPGPGRARAWPASPWRSPPATRRRGATSATCSTSPGCSTSTPC